MLDYSGLFALLFAGPCRSCATAVDTSAGRWGFDGDADLFRGDPCLRRARTPPIRSFDASGRTLHREAAEDPGTTPSDDGVSLGDDTPFVRSTVSRPLRSQQVACW